MVPYSSSACDICLNLKTNAQERKHIVRPLIITKTSIHSYDGIIVLFFRRKFRNTFPMTNMDNSALNLVNEAKN